MGGFVLNAVARTVCLGLLLTCVSPCCGADPVAAKPKFVFILVDDLGFMDIGANNPETFYETPHVDRLAAEGVRFTSGYAANPVCSPTRFSLLTGRYPTRVQATNWFSGKREGKFRPAPLREEMPLEEVTIAELLQPHGYRTAFLGKWHLGSTEDLWPEHQGFEFNVGGFSRGGPNSYFSPYKNPRLSDGPEGEHLTARLTEETLKLLEQLKDEPFFIYLSFYTVHTPLRAPEELITKYRNKRAELPETPEFAEEEQIWPTDEPRRVRIVQNHPTYAAMVESMDRGVGRILDKLRELQIDDQTIVCFFSDNGGLSTSEGSPTSNLPFRGGKGWLYEGGIREPMIIKWPQAGHFDVVRGEPVSSIDFLPTILDIARIPIPDELVIDGVSLVPLLTGAHLPDRNLFWHYPHYSNQGGFPGGAIRHGNFKLIERYETGQMHLYDLDTDPGERLDLAEDLPETAAALRKDLHNWYREVDAQFLQPNAAGEAPAFQLEAD